MTKFIFSFLLAAQFGYSQHIIINTGTGNSITISDDFELFVPQNNNQYLSTHWSKGKLFYANGTSKFYDSLNFDRHANRLEVVSQNKPLLLMPMGVSGALITRSEQQKTLLVVGKINELSVFLLVVSEGKHLLATYLTTNVVEDVRGFRTDEVRFVPKEQEKTMVNEHYVLLRDGNWERIKLNKSVIGKIFELSKKEIQAIMSEKGIRDNKQGQIDLFQLLNIK